MAHIALVYNSMSGGYSARRIDALIDLLHQAGHRVSLFSDIGFSIKRDCPNADILCIAGGDGTVRTTLEYQRDAKVRPLCAVFPTGTVNLVAREVPYPRAARAFREIIDFQRPARVHHAGLVAGRLFLTSASVGPDSVAVHRLNIDLKRQIGRLAYIFALLAGPWPRPRLRVTSGGQTYDAEAVYVLKSRYFGGPFVLDEKAALTNDRFRVLLMPRARRRDVARLILYALTRGRFVDPAWQFLETTELEIAGDRPWPVQADGDIVSQLPVHIRIDPAPIPHL